MRYFNILTSQILCLALLTTSLVWAQEQSTDPLPITVKRLGDISEPIERSVPATLISLNDATLSPELSAQVKQVSVQVGDRVEKGEVLAVLDCRDPQVSLRQAKAAVATSKARIEATQARAAATGSRIAAAQARQAAAQERVPSAQAQLRLAQTQLQRNQKLRQDGLIPTEMLDQARSSFESAQSGFKAAQEDVNAARAEVTSARAELTAAKADLETVRTELASAEAQVTAAEITVGRCRVTASFDGQITQRHLQLGQMANPANPAFQILETAAVEVVADLSADDLRDLAQVDKLRFMAEGDSYPLQVRAVVGQISGATRTQKVRFSLTASSRLPAGQKGQVRWQGRLPAIPAGWVMRRDGQLGVMLVAEGKARFKVLPNALEGQPVLTDLSADTRLIDENRIRLRDGEAISIVEQTD